MTWETDEWPDAPPSWGNGCHPLLRRREQPGGLLARAFSHYRRVASMAAGALLLLGVMASQSGLAAAQERLDIEERARTLDQQLICPVCPGETLHQSQATLAEQMRRIIRERLAEGQSEGEILDYFVSVYGDSVLAAPPRRGFGLVAWLVPPLALIAGGIVVLYTLRVLRASPVPAANPEVPAAGRADLERYLRLVDQEMGGAGGPATPEQSGPGEEKPTNG